MDRTAAGIINAALPCWRKMYAARSRGIKSIADQLVAKIRNCPKIKVGPAYHKETGMGPYIPKVQGKCSQMDRKGIEEGASSYWT